MTTPARHPYTTRVPGIGRAGLAPLLPLTLSLGSVRVDVSGLLDTGGSVNVLPHTLGLQLGAVWSRQTMRIPLGGALSGAEARVLDVTGIVGSFPPVRLTFGWAATDTMPVILGQINFFVEFDVCFYGSTAEFDIRPTTRSSP